MINFLNHARFKARSATARSALSDVWRTAFAALGRYRPLTANERRRVQGDAVPFHGDIPINAGTEHCQYRLSFAEERPLVEEVADLVYTPSGGGWSGGCLYERYSACAPGLRMLVESTTPAREVAEAYIIQAEHFDTFGDWFSEYLAPLSLVGDIRAPVLLPKSMGARAYVKRDTVRTDIAFEPVEAPVLVRKAIVVRQPRVIRYWQEKHAASMRRFLKPALTSPAAGSLLYLSRYGEKSEVADRTYPSEAVEHVVKARGGSVLRTANTTLEDYLEAAKDAETVLYDHGSAAYNMIYWRPRRAIEFVCDDWWVNAFLFFADSIGVKDYTILCTDRGGVDAFIKRLESALDRPVNP